MIHILKGVSIFESPASNIVIPVNCVGVMGKGLAKEYKERYPNWFQIYRNYCYKKELIIGTVAIIYGDAHNSILFPTKNHWRNKSKIEYILQGLKGMDWVLKELKDPLFAHYGNRAIAFPKIGCGLGGLDWERQVKPMIFAILGTQDIEIYLHE